MHYSGFVVLSPPPLGKAGCPRALVTTAHADMVLCLVPASAAALTSHSRCGFYTLVLLLSHVTSQPFPSKRHTVPETCYSCSFSHADTNKHNSLTPPPFLTRTWPDAGMG